MRFKKNIAKGLVLGVILINLNESYIVSATESIKYNSNTEKQSIFKKNNTTNRYEILTGKSVTINESSLKSIEEIEILAGEHQSYNTYNEIGTLYRDENGNPILNKEGGLQYEIKLIASDNPNILDLENKVEYSGGEYSFTTPIDSTKTKNFTLTGTSIKDVTIGIKRNNNSMGSNLIESFDVLKGDFSIEFTVPDEIDKFYIGAKSGYYVLPTGNGGKIQISKGFNNFEYTTYSNDRKEEILSLILPSKLECIDGISDRLSWDKIRKKYVINKIDGSIVETDITTKIDISLFSDKTFISLLGPENKTLKIKVDQILKVSQEGVEQAELSKDPIDIEDARNLVNQLPESQEKEQLQERLDAISPDISLEKLKSTSNLDVYIKSENMLSLSLNTNSITFEDFSGVEDVVKENAINLTVSSSLPYKVNAYMPTEIKGSEGNTMSNEVLNIRANGTNIYKEFENTITPIILLDDQSKGNDVIHGIDLMLKGDVSHNKDVYKTTIKFEVVQK